MRLGVAVMVLVDLADWFYWAPELLSDQGLSPRLVTTFVEGHPYRPSYYNLVGSTWGVRALLSLNIAAALALLVGVFPRVAALACYLMYMGLHHRMNFHPQASDLVIKFGLLWMSLLPIGEQFAWKRPSPPPRAVVSGATVGLLSLMFWLYFGAGVCKFFDPLWMDGVAVYYSLIADDYPSKLGAWLLQSLQGQMAMISPLLTYFVVSTELVAPCTLILPWRQATARMVGVTILSALQLSFTILLRLGLFSAQCWVVLIGLIPSEFWKKPALEADPWRKRDSVLAGGVAVLMMCSLVLTLGSVVAYPAWMVIPVRTIGLGGYWPMFTRLSEVGQLGYEIRGYLQDGTKVDLFRKGAPLRKWEGPVRGEDTLVFNQRSLGAYRQVMSGSSGNAAFLAVGKFLCRQWNLKATAGKKAELLEFVLYKRDAAPYFAYGPTREKIQYRWPCAGVDAL